MKPLAIILAALALTACATAQEPAIRTVEVRVPVPVSCVPDGTPDRPPARAELPADTGAMIQAIAGELIERRAYDDAVSGVIAACRRAGSP